MARLFAQYLAIYNTKKLLNNKNICESRYKLLPNSNEPKNYYIFCQSGEISPNLVTLICQSMYAIIAAAKNVKVGITLLCQKLLLLLFQSKCTYAIRTVFYNEKPITQLKGHYKTWLK